MCWLLGPDDKAATETYTAPMVDEIIYSKVFLDHRLEHAYFLDTVKVTDEQIRIIAKETDGQRTNPLWHL